MLWIGWTMTAIGEQSFIINNKDRSFTASAGTQAAVLLKAGVPPRLQFYQELNRSGTFRYFSHPTLSLVSEQILKDLKRSQGHQRGGEESVFD